MTVTTTPTAPSTTPAVAPASTIADLSPEALNALTKRLQDWTGRTDVEILAITGVQPSTVTIWMQTHAALGIDVAFTYTSGRRSRRTKTLAWPVGMYTSPGHQDYNLPPALWAFLTAAVATHGQPT